MIVQLTGQLIEGKPLSVVLDCGGIGYEVHVPVTTAERLSGTGSKVMLYIHAVYREDSQTLYGFSKREERDFFRLITEKVSGIGPKIGLSIMSKLSLPMLQSAIAQGDVGLLSKCPGIGKKTAERLCVELKDKVLAKGVSLGTINGEISSGSFSNEEVGASRIQDAVAALMTLGYKADVADRSVRKTLKELGEGVSTEALIKGALR